MCKKRRFFIAWLLLWSLSPVFSQSGMWPAPAAVLEEIRAEAALIRRESNALGTLLSLLESESAESRNRLGEVEAALSEAETLLAAASLSLEKSEAALIPLREELGKLRNELAALKRQAVESNRRLTRSTRAERFWRAAAISVALAFAGVELWRGLRK